MCWIGEAESGASGRRSAAKWTFQTFLWFWNVCKCRRKECGDGFNCIPNGKNVVRVFTSVSHACVSVENDFHPKSRMESITGTR